MTMQTTMQITFPDRPVLALDIGAGTQDIWLYDPALEIENCVKLVLPSPTAILASRTSAATAQGKSIFLTGPLMGGGPLASALKKHLRAGLCVFATDAAAKTIRDDLEEVRRLGVRTVSDAGEVPHPFETLVTGDVDLDTLRRLLEPYGVELPQAVAVAVQDHGESTTGSNRAFRFEQWRRFVEQGGSLTDLAYFEIPTHLTRMKAVQQDIAKVMPVDTGAMLMDTGAAAIWGALCDTEVGQASSNGALLVNVGNQHVIAFLVKGGRVWGVFEHHTVLMDAARLEAFMSRFRLGELAHAEVFDDRGHGCFAASRLPSDFAFTAVTGPKRQMAHNLGWRMAAPFGDMMLTGCFGLVAAYGAAHNTPCSPNVG